jgi:SAM-dependent methyltransferase
MLRGAVGIGYRSAYRTRRRWKGAALRARRRAAHPLLAPVLRNEWAQPGQGFNERTREYEFALRSLLRVRPNTVLDVGTGSSSWPHLLSTCGYRVTAVDDFGSFWTSPLLNRHFHVLRQDITRPDLGRRFDAVTCISVLEHIPDHRAAMRGMFELLDPGGHLVLTVPYNERRYVANAYAEPGAGYGQNAPYICQIYSRETLEQWLSDSPYSVVLQEHYRAFTGPLWTQGERVIHPEKVSASEEHHLTGLLLRPER